ncbi:MAG TPA: hypothetical protein HPP54_10660 [Nitrospinae bacterium]|jgi:hypothetical protein|nr:hypothetical protein [Nitrospinota bacterium]
MPDDQEPVLNKEAALELCDDDEDLFLEIVQAYLEDAIEHFKYLLYTLEVGDAHQVEERTHTIKGASSNICAGRVVKQHNYWNGQGVMKTSARHRNFIKFLRRNSSVCWSISTTFRRLLLDNKAGITYKN